MHDKKAGAGRGPKGRQTESGGASGQLVQVQRFNERGDLENLLKRTRICSLSKKRKAQLQCLEVTQSPAKKIGMKHSLTSFLKRGNDIKMMLDARDSRKNCGGGVTRGSLSHTEMGTKSQSADASEGRKHHTDQKMDTPG